MRTKAEQPARQHPTPMPWRLFLLSLALGLAAAGCGVLPFYTRANEPLPAPDEVRPTRARTTVTPEELPEGLFVGVALSGGGSRAANFSAALLFELERLGVLPRFVSALSSVSGSSVTAAYYGLFSGERRRWNPERVRALLATDFEQRWITRWFFPQNVLRYWFTKFDRSDIMKGVFDDVLFEGKRFGDMPPDGPRILVNATSLGEAAVRFVFSDEKLSARGSRLDTYPVSHAVVASGAFPAALTSVTLEVYSREDESDRYLHVYDGGVADNLGITTLVHTVRDLSTPAARRPKGCFLFVFDAHTFDPEEQIRGQRERDPRGLIDFFVDRNVLDASGALLSKHRRSLLEDVGVDQPALAPVGSFTISSETPEPRALGECTVWLLTFDRLWALAASAPSPRGDALRELARTVNRIPTRYLLKGPEGMTADELQEALFRAAKILLWEDAESLSRACRWFRTRDVELAGCARRGPGGSGPRTGRPTARSLRP